MGTFSNAIPRADVVLDDGNLANTISNIVGSTSRLQLRLLLVGASSVLVNISITIIMYDLT